MTVAWWAEYHAPFDLAVPVGIRMQRVEKRDIALAVPAGIGMSAAGRSGGGFALDVPAAIDIEAARGPGGSFGPGGFGLAVPAGIELDAIEHYGAELGLAVPVSIVTAAGMRPSAELALPVPAALTMGGLFKPAGAHYTDNFDSYADGALLASAAPTLWPASMISGGTVQKPAANGTVQFSDSCNMYNLALLTDDFEFTVQVSSIMSGATILYLDTRCNPSRFGGYYADGAHVHMLIDWGYLSNGLGYRIEQHGSGAWNWSGGTLVAQANPGGNMAVNDKFTIRAEGNVYSILRNGVTALTWTDSANTHPRNANHRHVSIGGYYVNLDNFEAKDVGAAPVTPPAGAKYSDDFNRADTTDVSGQPAGTPGNLWTLRLRRCGIYQNRAYGAGNGWAAITWNQSMDTDNHKVSAVGNWSNGFGIVLFAGCSTAQCCGAVIEAGTVNIVTSTDWLQTIQNVRATASQQPMTDGDRWSIERSGNTFVVRRNGGAAVVTWNHGGAYPAGASYRLVGFGGFNNVGITGFPPTNANWIDDWEADEI